MTIEEVYDCKQGGNDIRCADYSIAFTLTNTGDAPVQGIDSVRLEHFDDEADEADIDVEVSVDCFDPWYVWEGGTVTLELDFKYGDPTWPDSSWSAIYAPCAPGYGKAGGVIDDPLPPAPLSGEFWVTIAGPYTSAGGPITFGSYEAIGSAPL